MVGPRGRVDPSPGVAVPWRARSRARPSRPTCCRSRRWCRRGSRRTPELTQQRSSRLCRRRSRTSSRRKKKSGLPNITNVGVRSGSVLIMCSAFSSTGSAMSVMTSSICGTPPIAVVRIESTVRSPSRCSSERTAESVRAGLPVDVERGRVVEVDVVVVAPGEALDLRVDLADLVRRAGGEVRARPVVVDQRVPVGLRDPTPPAKWSPSSTVITKSVLPLLIPCCSRFVEERLEGGVVVLQLLQVRQLTGPGGRARVRVAGEVRDVQVVRVGDVPVGHGDAGLLHRPRRSRACSSRTSRRSPGSRSCRAGR